MGVDCKYTIPAQARLRDVADVAGILLGCKVTEESLGSGRSTYAKVHGITYRTSDDMPECIRIVYPDSCQLALLYHYEWDLFGNHGIMPRSRARNIALCVALCDFFGGSVDFNDYDDDKDDHSAHIPDDIHAEDGDEWDAFQQRKLSVQPLTKQQIRKYEHVAVYKDDR